MFWQVSWSNYNQKKKVQSSDHRLECLGVPWAWIVLAGSSIKLRPEKRYSHLAIGCNVWGVPWAWIVLAGLLLCFLMGSLIKLQITARKKVQSSGHWLEYLLRTFDSFWMGVIPLESSSLLKSIRKVSITATCRLEWHYQISKQIMAFSLSIIEIQWFFFQVDT
jgi:hypothetical protein